jgi:hypothetical protein
MVIVAIFHYFPKITTDDTAIKTCTKYSEFATLGKAVLSVG